uniref:O-fucosyltransferase family protein n=1 Tax=Heterorhabditis bacteriophora TaxID=37862 RepID=A0A1I7XCJ9_HETBA
MDAQDIWNYRITMTLTTAFEENGVFIINSPYQECNKEQVSVMDLANKIGVSTELVLALGYVVALRGGRYHSLMYNLVMLSLKIHILASTRDTQKGKRNLKRALEVCTEKPLDIESVAVSADVGMMLQANIARPVEAKPDIFTKGRRTESSAYDNNNTVCSPPKKSTNHAKKKLSTDVSVMRLNETIGTNLLVISDIF